MKLLRITASIFCILFSASCASQTELELMPSSAPETHTPSTQVPQADIAQLTSMPQLSRSDFSYIILNDNELLEDEENSALPGFIDIISFRKIITDNEITVFIELRELPETYVINQSSVRSNVIEYSWRVNFDADYDDTLSYDISLVHQKFWNRTEPEKNTAIDDAAFETVAVQHQVSTGQNIAEGSIEIDGNTIIINYDTDMYPELKIINADTPIHIFAEYSSGSAYLYDLIPRQ